jgi:tetratricopeptide (TPR) repeat protein
MKTTLSILILLVITNFGFSQNSTTNFEQKLYDEATSKINALDYLEIENTEIESKEVTEYKIKVRKKVNAEALDIFNKILDTLPKTKLLNKIHYQIARIYFEDKNTKLASEFYEKVLKNSDPITDGFENEIRNSICLTLSNIYIENNDYEKALKFLEESKKYKIRFDCGNSAIESSKEFENLYQICREGINKKK